MTWKSRSACCRSTRKIWLLTNGPLVVPVNLPVIIEQTFKNIKREIMIKKNIHEQKSLGPKTSLENNLTSFYDSHLSPQAEEVVRVLRRSLRQQPPKVVVLFQMGWWNSHHHHYTASLLTPVWQRIKSVGGIVTANLQILNFIDWTASHLLDYYRCLSCICCSLIHCLSSWRALYTLPSLLRRTFHPSAGVYFTM